MRPIRILVVEDDEDFRHLIIQTLELEEDLTIVGLCRTREDAVCTALQTQPDIALMDLSLSRNGMEGVEAARVIRRQTDAKVLILSGYEDPEIVLGASRRAFASGYIMKSQFFMMVPTIQQTMQGPTPQSHMIRAALMQQLSAAEQCVCRRMLGEDVLLRSSEKTIANQQTSILKKLGLSSKKELCHIFSVYLNGAKTGKRIKFKGQCILLARKQQKDRLLLIQVHVLFLLSDVFSNTFL